MVASVQLVRISRMKKVQTSVKVLLMATTAALLLSSSVKMIVNSRIAKVVILMPPAVDPEAPPMNISAMALMSDESVTPEEELYKLVAMSVRSETGETPHAAVTLIDAGREATVESLRRSVDSTVLEFAEQYSAHA